MTTKMASWQLSGFNEYCPCNTILHSALHRTNFELIKDATYFILTGKLYDVDDVCRGCITLIREFAKDTCMFEDEYILKVELNL